MDKKKKKALTPEEQLQADINLENELGRLQRQYKILDRDRSGFSSGSKFAKQQKILSILKHEQANVITDLFVATCSTKKTRDAQITNELVGLLKEHDTSNGEIKERKGYIEDIDGQINQLQKAINIQRSKTVTDIEVSARVTNAQKTLECLENKLDAAIKRFNIILTENRKIREEINHLLLERMVFNKKWEHMIGNLNKGKSFMMDLIEQATIAYDQREEWVSKLQALRQRSHNDLLLHTQDMQDLQCKLNHDMKLEAFLETKGQKRLMQRLFNRAISKRDLTVSNWQESRQKYNSILDSIMKFSGASDVQAYALMYTTQEEENFAQFTYTNVLYKDIEDLTASLVELHPKIESQRALNEQRAKQQLATLAKLKNELKDTKKEADVTQSILNGTQESLTSLYNGIEKLFNLCKCSNAPFLELLGDNTTINDYNVHLYLEMLEGTLSELIMNVYYRQKTATKKEREQYPPVIRDDEKVRALNILEEIVPTNPCPLCVEQENVSDVIDSLQFIQSREEVTEKLKLRLMLPDGLERLHNVSACHLPASRQIIQRRYQ